MNYWKELYEDAGLPYPADLDVYSHWMSWEDFNGLKDSDGDLCSLGSLLEAGEVPADQWVVVLDNNPWDVHSVGIVRFQYAKIGHREELRLYELPLKDGSMLIVSARCKMGSCYVAQQDPLLCWHHVPTGKSEPVEDLKDWLGVNN